MQHPRALHASQVSTVALLTFVLSGLLLVLAAVLCASAETQSAVVSCTLDDVNVSVFFTAQQGQCCLLFSVHVLKGILQRELRHTPTLVSLAHTR